MSSPIDWKKVESLESTRIHAGKNEVIIMNVKAVIVYVFWLLAALLVSTLCAAASGSGQPTVYFIPFHGEVENALYGFLQRGFHEAEAMKADQIVVEMDTPGGRVDAALHIADMMMESPVPVLMYVAGNATSAGAIISLAADRIFMRDGATIGTAAPVIMGQGGESETMNDKALSYVLAQVRAICEKQKFNERKTQLALAMVDKDVEIRDEDDSSKFISEKGKLLTMTAKEALHAGFIDEIIDAPAIDSGGKEAGRTAVLIALGMEDAQRLVLRETAFDALARLLSSMTVSSLLLTVAFLGVFIELRTPGIGLPGLIGALAFLLFFFGHSLTGLAGWEGMVFFMVGMILLAIEVFIIPGFGFVGIAGVICLLTSVVVTLMDAPLTSPDFRGTFEWADLTQPLMVTTMAMTIGVIGAIASPLLIPIAAENRWFSNWLLLSESEERGKGYQSADEQLAALVGLRGVARSALRPAGAAEIEGQRIDVVSEGGFIPVHTAVEVVKVEGRRVVVRPSGGAGA
ncbi:MAG: hypothetical protein GC154_08550 [bacterium]|nr:hypothetical protein [bacterium]